MAKKNELGDFKAVTDMFVRSDDIEDVELDDTSVGSNEDPDDVDFVDPSKAKDPEKDEKEIDENKDDPSMEEDEEDDSTKKDEEKKDEKKDNSEIKPDTDEEESVDDDTLDELEPQLAKYIQEKLYNKLGWEVGENEEEPIDSIDAIVNVLQEAVEEASQPIFASEDVEKLNQYVENGGNLRKYFESRYSAEVDLEKISLGKEVDQERILREYFKTQNIPDDKIDKRIQRYSDTGSLQDEAEDALEILKDIKGKEAQKLLEQQQKLMEDTLKTQQKFHTDVTSYIKSLKDINGIPLDSKKKEQLIRDLLVPEKDGRTKYQKKYEDSMVSNFVKSGFITLVGDEYNKKIERKAKSNTVKEIKQKLDAAKRNPRLKNTRLDNKISAEDALKSFSSVLVGEN